VGPARGPGPEVESIRQHVTGGELKAKFAGAGAEFEGGSVRASQR
jgi:hypothetical protein